MEGLEGAMRRAEEYADAGADAIFPEALLDAREFESFRARLSVPLLANMTEFGASPLLGARELEDIGYGIVIYPVTSLRLAMKAVEDGLLALRDAGTQAALVPAMQTRTRLYELVRYERYESLDRGVYDSVRDAVGATAYEAGQVGDAAGAAEDAAGEG